MGMIKQKQRYKFSFRGGYIPEGMVLYANSIYEIWNDVYDAIHLTTGSLVVTKTDNSIFSIKEILDLSLQLFEDMGEDLVLIDTNICFQKLKFIVSEEEDYFYIERNTNEIAKKLRKCLEWAGIEILDFKLIAPYNFYFEIQNDVIKRNIVVLLGEKYFSEEGDYQVEEEELSFVGEYLEGEKTLVFSPYGLSHESENFLLERDFLISSYDITEWANIARLYHKLHSFGVKEESYKIRKMLSGKQQLSVDMLEKIARIRDKNKKGKKFEEFIRRLFREINGFKIEEECRIYTSAGEFDIYVRNNRKEGIFSKFIPGFFIECKNWENKITSNEIDHFSKKLKSKGVNGIIVTIKGMTKKGRRTAKESIEESRGEGIDIIVLEKGDLIDMVKSIEEGRDAAEVIINKYHEQIKF